jgi:uncharacterized protein YerC
MPHVSSEPLRREQIDQLNKNFVRLLAGTIASRREQALSELLTHTERLMIAKRLGMLLLISEGVSTYYISKRLHVSPSTVARFETKVESGAFDKTLIFLKKKKHTNTILSILGELAAVPFEVRQRPMRMRQKMKKEREDKFAH